MTLRVRAFVCCAFGVLIASALPAVCSAQGGSPRLDPGFGKSGLALTKLGIAGEEQEVQVTAVGAAAVIADGGSGTAVRVRADGSWDGGFGDHGRLLVPTDAEIPGSEGITFAPDSITADSRGRVLAFGIGENRSVRKLGPEGLSFTPSFATVLRYRPSGRLDPTFGDGKGFVSSTFGVGPEQTLGFERLTILAGRVDSHDRPVFVIGAGVKAGGCYGKSTIKSLPRALARLTEAGHLDPSFGGGDGISPLGGSSGSPGLGLDAREGVVVSTGRVGGYAAECGAGTTLYRFGRDGRPVSTFGSSGVRSVKSMHLALVEPSGGTILNLRRRATLELSRLKPDGSRVSGFGRGGVARVPVPFGRSVVIHPVAVDGRGRILLAGSFYTPQVGGGSAGSKHSAFVVGRLLPDGRMDRSFGRRGWLFTSLPRPLELDSTAATLDSKGRLLVAGFVTKPGQSNGGFAVARYLVGGS
jgi:uncharacterized delta-60 repeat protein